MKGAPGEHQFDLGGQLPTDRLRVALPQPNTVASIALRSRAKPADPWRRVRTTVVYRLNRDGDEVKSAEVAVATNTDRYWLRVDQRGGGIGLEAPRLYVVGWVPHRLVFAARGKPPFLLAYAAATRSRRRTRSRRSRRDTGAGKR